MNLSVEDYINSRRLSVKRVSIQDTPPIKDALYQDEFCAITPEMLIINAYFYPSSLQLRLGLDKIQQVYFEKQKKDLESNAKKWGLDKNCWWARDYKRDHHMDSVYYHVAVDCGTRLRIFSVRDIYKFLEALKENCPNISIQQSLPI